MLVKTLLKNHLIKNKPPFIKKNINLLEPKAKYEYIKKTLRYLNFKIHKRNSTPKHATKRRLYKLYNRNRNRIIPNDVNMFFDEAFYNEISYKSISKIKKKKPKYNNRGFSVLKRLGKKSPRILKFKKTRIYGALNVFIIS